MKRNSSPSFNKINVTQQVQQCLNPSNVFTPIKGVEQLQNSSYIQCNHIDPMAVYDEDAWKDWCDLLRKNKGDEWLSDVDIIFVLFYQSFIINQHHWSNELLIVRNKQS